jgi:hypothetical protein
MDGNQVRASIDATVAQFRRYVPLMAPYFDDQATLREHSARLAPTATRPPHATRLELLARVAGEVARRAFGPSALLPEISAEDVRAINIVDHHQLLNHPLLLGTNVIANASRLLGDGPRRPILTFSCANVAPANYYLRNGFCFAGKPVAYFSAKEYQDVMYHLDARRYDFVERLHATKRWREFTPGQQGFLVSYQELLAGLDTAHTTRHRDQLALALRSSWPLLFHPDIRADVPELLYLNAEEVTRDCLLTLLAQENHLAESLFDPVFRRTVLDRFRGIVVAWDEAAGKGTHFFWRRHPDRPRLLRMYVDGGELVPADPRYRHLSVPLERAAVLDHLRRDEILPSVALSVSLFLYLGMRPLVGPGSLVYFSLFRDRWGTLLAEQGLAVEAELVSSVDTGGLIAGTPVFFAREGETLRTLYAADVMATGGMDAHYLRTVLDARFSDVLSVGASGVYELFAGSYIPRELHLTDRVGFDEAATVVHQWI